MQAHHRAEDNRLSTGSNIELAFTATTRPANNTPDKRQSDIEPRSGEG
jgi:hypothetical protein